MRVGLKCSLQKIVVIFFFCILTGEHGYSQTDPKALFDMAVSNYKQGNYQEAIDLFTELIVIAPDNAKAYKNRGVALMSVRKMDDAIQDFNTALRIDPSLKGLYSNLGAAWHYKGEYEKAVFNYDIAIKEAPNSYVSYFNRAISRVALNRLEEARADLEKTLALNPGFDPAVSAKQDVQKMLAETSGKSHVVQAGAFLVETNALEMKTNLIEKGVDARIVVLKDAKQRTWYLVRCGNNLTHEAAKRLNTQLKKRYHIDSVIRPEDWF
ncbi:MAG: tetratricopeptide repeat protein [Desulfobacterales bacterium]|nr:tetratricopeptide repeat protein [Desulfobacterales bacterium]